MKIKKAIWDTHNILGSLQLDFTNAATGEPYDNIIFAGENGTGKTTILSTLVTFLNRGSFAPFLEIDYVANGISLKAIHPVNRNQNTFFYDTVDDAGNRRSLQSDKSHNPKDIEVDAFDIRHYGCVMSKARADFKTQRITQVTTKKLDVEKYDVDGEDDFTSLKQLIVDIQNQDNAEYAEVNKQQGPDPIPWGHFYTNSRTYRFKNAFDNFFENISFERVADVDSAKSIIFRKGANEIDIDSLSTGEKQIVFRGVYLLKNAGALAGAAVLIDEPELSMHPKWQKKILKYYQDLFVEAGVQRAQLFFATHSEYIIEEALKQPQNNLVIILNDVGGKIQAKRIDSPMILPSITIGETTYRAFDVVSNDLHIELYGFLQAKNGLRYVKDADNFIKAQLQYDPTLHAKASANPHGGTTYDTLSTFIRNAIDHPNTSGTFTYEELKTSIILLTELCK